MEDYLILIIFGFLASFIDSIAGGGGIISVPALLFTGLPPSIALGTNKMASSMGSMVSSITYLRSSHVDTDLMKRLIPYTAIGAIIGVFTLSIIPSDILQPIIVILLLIITIITILKPNKKSDNVETISLTSKNIFFLIFMAVCMGFYDGFFGPGTGSFLIFGFSLLHFSFLKAAANAKILNFTSNIVSLIAFYFLDLIQFKYGIVMGLAMLPGAYFGSRLALTNGSKLVKPCFIVMTLLIVGKQIIELL